MYFASVQRYDEGQRPNKDDNDATTAREVVWGSLLIRRVGSDSQIAFAQLSTAQ